ncbi:putative quinol monooxygenase [Glacieibacterium megasporae]|uniref:putative quinol monooxygenase n=1 Tax=Glacieibacterium megasporae TaxID=2835787 RepID=UPI001C1E8B8F|nr:putative quinol monooxygenase [Polymorphobacter megasporae]UAJ10677.1 antibiotic biosynthesis monooxygenase [Polymorphobacter megasporae]
MSITPVNFIVRFQARPGREDDLHAILAAMIAPTRAEPGCVNYDLHRREDDVAQFVLYEGWESKQAQADHMALPHFVTMLEAVADVVSGSSDDGKPYTAETLVMITDRVSASPT